MQTLDYANAILKNDGEELYESKLKENGVFVSLKKTLLSTKKELRVISYDYAYQVVYRHHLLKLSHQLKKYIENNPGDKAALRFLSLIVKLNKVFDNKLDNEKTNNLLVDVFKLISENIVYEQPIITYSNHDTVRKNVTILEIAPLNNNYKALEYTCNRKLDKILSKIDEITK